MKNILSITLGKLIQHLLIDLTDTFVSCWVRDTAEYESICLEGFFVFVWSVKMWGVCEVKSDFSSWIEISEQPI